MTTETRRVELDGLRGRVEELEETLRAITGGEVDALVVKTSEGPCVYTLEDARDIYRYFVDLMQEGAAAVSATGTITYANRRLAGLLGRELDQVFGTGLERVVHPDDVDVVHRVLGEAATGHDEVRLLSDTGPPVPIKLAWSRLPGPGEARICLVCTDLTRQKQTEELLLRRANQQRGVAELASEALLHPSLQPLLESAVGAVARTLDAELVKVLELRPDGCFVVRASVGFRDDLLAGAAVPGGSDSQAGYVLLSDEPVLVDDLQAETRFTPTALLLDSGVVSSVSVRVGPREKPFGVLGAHARRRRRFSNDHVRFLEAVAGILGTSLQRIEAEEEVHALNLELEQRVAERTRELRSANAELESFASSVSHDLRAPVRAVAGFSEVVLSEYGGLIDDRGRDYLARMRAAAQRMGSMIDVLLALSRVSREQLRRVQVDASELVREIVGELREAEPGRPVETVVADDLVVFADRALLRIVFENLLSNAWKFTATTEPARIEVGSALEGGEQAFFVRDNGVGFEMDYVDQLFRPFQRLHRVDEFPGAGIGLATVARIVSRHGGRVWASGKPGHGACFSFTLGEETPATAS